MARRIELTRGFYAGMKRLGARGRAVGPTLRRMLGEVLPSPLDFVVLVPPTARAWVRRVPSQNLWVYYRFDDAAIWAVAVTDTPPVPLDV